MFWKLDVLLFSGVMGGKDLMKLGPLEKPSLDHWASHTYNLNIPKTMYNVQYLIYVVYNKLGRLE
jgi:hypothetical protein